jgi:acyl dehydratase
MAGFGHSVTVAAGPWDTSRVHPGATVTLRRRVSNTRGERGRTDRMALNKDFIGRTFPPSEPYEISRVKIREFANAIGDDNPVYRETAAANAAGHPDVICPPTFAIVVGVLGSSQVVRDPGLGLDYSMVVHGEQRFHHTRPLRAGDVVTSQSTVENIREVGRLSMLTTKTEIKTVEGELVCTARTTLVERGA